MASLETFHLTTHSPSKQVKIFHFQREEFYLFSIIGGKTYTIKVDVIDSPHFYISEKWECKIVQRICSFKINSLKGWGTSECQQRNMLGRNIQNCNKKKEYNEILNKTYQSISDICVKKQQNIPSTDVDHTGKEKTEEVNKNIDIQKFQCEHCEMFCESRVKLWRHLRTHDNTAPSIKKEM